MPFLKVRKMVSKIKSFQQIEAAGAVAYALGFKVPYDKIMYVVPETASVIASPIN